MSPTAFFQQLVNGLTLGGMYALVALGYTMVYGVIQLINFAHGEVFMLGAFLGLTILHLAARIGVGSSAIALGLAFVGSMAITGFAGIAIERIAYRPLRHSPRITLLLSAVGMSIFLQNMVMLLYSRDMQPFPRSVHGGFDIAGVIIDNIQVLILAASLALMVGLDLLVQRTRLGQAMRAIAQDLEGSLMMGIDANQVIRLTFLIGSALAAAGGIMNGLYYGGIKFDMGFIIGIKAFAAAVLGGIGSLRGAMLGGLILGLSETLLVAALSSLGVPEAFDYKDVIAFALLIAVLIFKPSGLLGERVAEKV
ncbi:MAG: branched-chain amino acid ABC transporter permease [Candidatus Abyssobacteria bacterium SURF_5]|uniref:Branched-chain amino acid ABC transporter permease n=1 Tax=Abyssobacteria bacterium (strain SURF_5) TaxID=2093360 RepID=A0A3A4NLI4_ABYX5|nr:MAG: branched-chain amino acid ABC transporter permease [Candidatus Abyssubacteria bacterium SURF_5]